MVNARISPPFWLAYKAHVAKRLGIGPPRTKLRLGYTPPPSNEKWTRHLLYFVYPVLNNGVWQRNLDQLKKRLHLFNGQRWVAIASPSKRDEVAAARPVIEYLGVGAANYMLMAHPQRRLGEVLAFTSLWEQLRKHNGPRDVTFYGHTKGATKPVDNTISVHKWGDLMYAANLDHWDDVARLLETHCTVGAFKKKGWWRGDDRFVRWHYHGTFYWVRNKEVFERNWRSVQPHYGGTEMWPGIMFDNKESACIFYGSDNEDFSMYSVPEAARAEGCLKLWPWPNRKGSKPEMVQAMRKYMESL